MSLTLQRIEALAPDQSSLSAARKLLKPSTWPTLAHGEGLIWGECQGSGTTPYRVVVHEADAGYKCTCPSRKFPCKHALALMWMRADQSPAFASATVPNWVKDWLSRRRGTSSVDEKEDEAEPKPRPSIRLAEEPQTSANVDPKSEQRAAAARERNRVERKASVSAGLEELDTWLSDQLQQGVVNFVAQAAQACRTIAQRLVDSKASGLAARLDSLPTRLYTLPAPARTSAAIRELGQIYAISQAYRRESQLPELLAADARQAVGWSVTRESLLSDSGTMHADAKWRVFADLSEVQPDRLRRVETWLWRESGANGMPQCALLIDFLPISAGATSGGYLVGDRIDAELSFYRSTIPLRAQINKLNKGAEFTSEPLIFPNETLAVSFAAYERFLAQLPWLGTLPLTFQSASVRRSGENLYLHDDESDLSLPLHTSQISHALPLTSVGHIDGVGLWNGYEFTLAWAETKLGRWLRS